jgi:hypothetical protein
METLRFVTQVDADGILRLVVPTPFSAQEVEVVVVVNAPPVPTAAVDAYGWPLGFFDRTYGALADDPLERPPQLTLEDRDPIE